MIIYKYSVKQNKLFLCNIKKDNMNHVYDISVMFEDRSFKMFCYVPPAAKGHGQEIIKCLPYGRASVHHIFA